MGRGEDFLPLVANDEANELEEENRTENTSRSHHQSPSRTQRLPAERRLQLLHAVDDDHDDVEKSLISGAIVMDVSKDDDGEETEHYSRYYTIDEALEKIGFGRYQIYLLFIIGFLTISDALEVMVLSVLSPALRCDWHLSSGELAFISTAVFLGMLAGAMFWGQMSDTFGRWPILVIAMVSISYFGFLSAASPTYGWLVFLRFMVGFGEVGTVQGYILYAELLPAAWRGKTLILSDLFWASGNFFEVVIAALIIPRYGWRALLAVTASFCLISLAFFKYVPESPRYYLGRGQYAKAESVLRSMAETNRGSLPAGTLKQHATNSAASIHARRSTVKAFRHQLLQLFNTTYRSTTFRLWFNWFIMSFGYYGVILSSAQLLERGRMCSGDAGTAQANDAARSNLAECGCNALKHSDYVSLAISSTGEYLEIVMNLILLDWIGRRASMTVHLIGAAISMLLMTVCTTRATLSFFMFLARAFISAHGSVTYVYTSEVYPTAFRALGLGLCSSIARFGSMSSPYIAQVLMDWSPNTALWVYAVAFTLAARNAWKLTIETKGRNLQETG